MSKTCRLLVTILVLLFLVGTSLAFNQDIHLNNNVKLHAPNSPGVNNVSAPANDEKMVIDMNDYYILNNGMKKSFLRKPDLFFILYKRKGTPLLTPELLQNRFINDFDVISRHVRGKRYVKIRIRKNRMHKRVITDIYNADPGIEFISHVFVSRDKGREAGVLPNIVVSIKNSNEHMLVMNELASYGLSLVRKLRFTDTEFEMKINEPVQDEGAIFQLARDIAKLPSVRWAEPNFVTDTERDLMPDDPLFSDQWHLHNTGQNGAVVDADIDGPEGWDESTGNNAVIAIYDDGVDTLHDDLNIWKNPGESGGGKESNGIDDDGNGFVDDYQGWDFTDNDNDPNPEDCNFPFCNPPWHDDHGTAVAGVAGAIGNNSTGVAGGAHGAFILPVRMNSGTCTDFADAMRYAGRYADVVNNSWSIGACESSLNTAISQVVNGAIAGARRGTLGTPVLFASGNNASGWVIFTLSGIPAGIHTFRWRYSKDISISSGYDTMWLDDIVWPGGGSTDFESDVAGDVPSGFTSGGDAIWTVISDGVHARGATGKSVKAGTITHSQETYLDITRSVGSGTLTFWAWVSSEQGYDFFDFYMDGTNYFHYSPGQYEHDNAVGYPASNPDTIAVGASNDGGVSGQEERSYYSQFGPELDVVAPSSGGAQGITTTDRSGNKGYSNTDYYSSFGGTSSATPLVAGIVADIITGNPSLTAAQIRTILHEGADKIGPYQYPGGRNDFYGYGRVNLFSSLCPDNDADGYTTCNNDCDDNDPLEYPGQIWYEDADVDLYSSGNSIVQCERQSGYYVDSELTATSGDCNDADISIHPGASEIPDDGIDQDCNGSDTITCIVDADQDGYGTDLGTTTLAPDGSCDTADSESATSDDCDDTDGSVHPGASEIPDDGIDQDCNGSDTITCIVDADQDGYGTDLGTTTLAPDGSCDTADFESATSDDCDDSNNNIYPGGPSLRIQRNPDVYYFTLQDAYDNAVAGETVQIQDTLLNESPVFNQTKTVNVQDGYDCSFSTPDGVTVLNGDITINEGVLVIQAGILEIQ